MGYIKTTILGYLKESIDNDDYIAPPNKVVYRAEHSGKHGSWFAFSKDDALGYMSYGGKIIKKDISGKKFVNMSKISENGEYYSEITKIYPSLFKLTDDSPWGIYEINVGKTEYFETIKDFLIKKEYSGIFTGNKLSIDYEVYLF